MRSNLMSRMSLVAAGVVVGLVTQAYGAVSVNPVFTVAFNDAADTAAFANNAGVNDGTGNADTWSVSGGMWNHSLSASGVSSNGSGQVVETAGVSGQSFTVSMDVTITARNLGGSSWNIQMPILSSNPTQTYWSGDTFYTVGVNLVESWSGGSDTFRILSSDVDGATFNPVVLASQDLSSRLLVDGTYNMSVTGTYTGGSLTLDAVLKEGNTTLASFQVVEASPKAGNYFGLSESLGFGSSGSASYDNFTISVPEPAALGLLGVAVVGLMTRRRATA